MEHLVENVDCFLLKFILVPTKNIYVISIAPSSFVHWPPEKKQERCFPIEDSFWLRYGILKWPVPISSYMCLYMRKEESKRRLNRFGFSFPPCLYFQGALMLDSPHTQLLWDELLIPDFIHRIEKLVIGFAELLTYLITDMITDP